MKKAIPRGFCATCRWARELPEKVRRGPFVLDCQGLPFIWEVRRHKSAVATAGGEAQGVVDVEYLPRIHTEKDFCALYEDVPAEATAN